MIADDLKQGKNRLKRAFTTAEVRSSESQSESRKENMPPQLSESDVREELDKIQQLNAQFNESNAVQSSQSSDLDDVDATVEREEENPAAKRSKTTHGKFLSINLYMYNCTYYISKV